MMIHHVSIPALDPEKVARVLGELTGAEYRPFAGGPVKGAYIVMSGDQYGTSIEIYPDDAVMTPGEGEVQSQFTRVGPSPTHTALHFLLSVDCDRETVLRIGEEAGWRVLNCWRGPPTRPVFELIEFWVENRLMIEVATKDMLPNYVRVHTAAAQDAAAAAMRAAGAARAQV